MTRREREALRRAGVRLPVREACAEFVEDVRERPRLALACVLGGGAFGLIPAALCFLYMAVMS